MKNCNALQPLNAESQKHVSQCLQNNGVLSTNRRGNETHHVREIRTVNLTTIGPDRCFKQGFGFKRSLVDPMWEAASAAEEAVQVVDLA